MFDRRQIFRTAWARAKANAKIYGGTARERFARCLVGVWAEVKRARQVWQAPETIAPTPALIPFVQRQAFYGSRRFASAFMH